MQNKMFQPGLTLHEVIIGAFKAQGTTFYKWCAENGIKDSTARQATYGQSGGDKGKALLARIIDGAGHDVVRVAYRARIEAEAKKLSEVAA